MSTAKALIRALRRQASLIEDLLDDGYDFILLVFRAIPYKCSSANIGQWVAVAFGLVWKIQYALKIFENQCLLKGDIGIDEEIKISCPGDKWIMKLKTDIDFLGISIETLRLSVASKEVAPHIAGYTAKKYLKKIKNNSCRKMHITVP